MQPLAGRVAIVTGAGRGLGRAHAVALGSAGARVVVNDAGCDVHGAGADPEVARAVVAEIRRAGGDAVANGEAVGSVQAAEAIVQSALDAWGRVDVLVNNAGITTNAPLTDLAPDDWERVLRVHLTGTFACARAAFAVMRAHGRGGRILNTTSGAALDRAYPGTAAYAAAKGGVVALTRVIAAEGAAHGITCNAIAPLARTRMSARFLADDPAEHDPGAVAPLIVYLASDAAGSVTGEVFRFRDGRLGVVRLTAGAGVAPAGARWTVDEIGRRIDEILARDA
jgi:NAD(P)-dependent dehydrogenase (short-subunit alcohol dehydrogenase family)